MTEYEVTFTGSRTFTIEADSEEQAEEEAGMLFDGQVDWETEINEVD